MLDFSWGFKGCMKTATPLEETVHNKRDSPAKLHFVFTMREGSGVDKILRGLNTGPQPRR